MRIADPSSGPKERQKILSEKGLSRKGKSLVYKICNSNSTVCLHVRGDNPRALASGLSPVHADKPRYSYLVPHSSL